MGSLRNNRGRWAVTLLMTGVAMGLLVSCTADNPGSIETMVAQEAKKLTLSGKGLKNPLPDTPESVAEGKEHFQHHCEICHGLDGHNTGVPFAAKMSPPVADLGQKNVQSYTDGQLKLIIENGLKFTGMPGWKGILDEGEMWHLVTFIRHLPAPGSEGTPAMFKEAEEEHQEMEHGTAPKPGQPKPGEPKPPHQHTHH